MNGKSYIKIAFFSLASLLLGFYGIYGGYMGIPQARAADTPSINVLSPNGGEKWEVGSTHTIKWTSAGISADTKMTVYLYNDDSVLPQIPTAIGFYEPNDGEMSWTIPADTFKSGDKYKIRIQTLDQTVSDYGNAYFNIVAAGSKNLPPVITSGSGPTTLKVGEIGSWAIKANDPENGALTYYIVWGDEAKGIETGLSFLAIPQKNADTQTATFTHSYIVEGNYVPAFTVFDDQSLSAKMSISVKVEGNATSTNPFITECFPDNTLIKIPDDSRVYVIKNCKKQWIKTVEEFHKDGYQWENVKQVSLPTVARYENAEDGLARAIKSKDRNEVYRIIEGKKLWVPDVLAFEAQGLKWEEVEEKNKEEVDNYPSATLIKAKGDPKVYSLNKSGLKKWIKTPEIFSSYSYKWSDIVETDSLIVNSFKEVK